MRIAIAADHNGTALKSHLVSLLNEGGHVVLDRGTHGSDVVDYPLLCADIGAELLHGHVDRGIVIGGSGQGESIACNKIRGIRAGLCENLFSAEISRAHNDSNVLVLGAKIVGPELAAEIVRVWLSTRFKGGIHQTRLDQIAAQELGHQSD